MQHPPSKADSPTRAAMADTTNNHKQSTKWANMTLGQEMMLAKGGERIKLLELNPAAAPQGQAQGPASTEL